LSLNKRLEYRTIERTRTYSFSHHTNPTFLAATQTRLTITLRCDRKKEKELCTNVQQHYVYTTVEPKSH
jgi:hypothetical protein